MKVQIQELATVMKLGSTSHRPNPPAVERSPAKKFKRVNVKQNSLVNGGTDAREGLAGPEANASGPFPPGQRPLQYHKFKGWGHVKRVCPSRLNYMRGECQEMEHSSPKAGACGNTDSNYKRDPIIAKAVKMADSITIQIH